jgi:hypothetical protein
MFAGWVPGTIYVATSPLARPGAHAERTSNTFAFGPMMPFSARADEPQRNSERRRRVRCCHGRGWLRLDGDEQRDVDHDQLRRKRHRQRDGELHRGREHGDLESHGDTHRRRADGGRHASRSDIDLHVRCVANDD